MKPVSPVRALAVLLFLSGCLLPIWFSLGDHPLYGRSDARYADVSATMAQSGGWLVPQFQGEPHLTKPPLIYWLEALSIRLLGQDEFAVRLPSALASSLLLVGVFVLVLRREGPRRALLATGLLSLMPLQVMMGRLTLTDPLLSLAWFGVLTGALLAVRQPHRHHGPLLLWSSAAVAFMAKGPVVLVALLVIVVWRAIAGADFKSLRSLAWHWGLPLAAAPVLVWAGWVAAVERQAPGVWAAQVLGRFTASADHPKPFWFFLPVFLGVLFPGTAIMRLPVFNYSWRRTWEMLSNGTDQALWTLAVVVPLAVFSLSTGKLSSYLLPLCAPLAIVTSAVLDHWLGQQNPEDSRQWPDVRITFFVCIALGIAGTIVFTVKYLSWPQLLWFPGPLVIALGGSAGTLVVAWRHGPRVRAVAMLAVWLAMVGSWLWLFELEDVFLARTSTASLLQHIGQRVPLSSAHVMTFGYEDRSLAFYGHAEARPIHDDAELRMLAASEGANLLILADPEDWSRYIQRHPDAAAQYQRLAEWPDFPLAKRRIVLRPY